MIYREGRKIVEPISLLAFGGMRLPVLDEDRINIDRNQVYTMLDYACENGITYFDTAFLYHKGISEVVLGEYFARHNRERILISTKMPWWLCKNRQDCQFFFQMQLEKMQLEYLDVYLLQGLNKKSWEKIKDRFVIDYLLDLKKSGKVKYIGFSFHDSYEVFHDIISYGIWDLCYIQMNIADMYSQATMLGVKEAYEKNIDVLVMEPLRGGKLVNNIPLEIQKKYQELNSNYSVIEWCFRWLYDSPYITSILSGMNNLEQVKENISIFQNAKENCLSDDEREVLQAVCRLYNVAETIPCTGCNYCMDCSNGLNIPQIFDTYNAILTSDNQFLNRVKYKRLTEGKNNVIKCTACGKCTKKCPQKIAISHMMRKIREYVEFNYGHL